MFNFLEVGILWDYCYTKFYFIRHKTEENGEEKPMSH